MCLRAFLNWAANLNSDSFFLSLGHLADNNDARHNSVLGRILQGRYCFVNIAFRVNHGLRALPYGAVAI